MHVAQIFMRHRIYTSSARSLSSALPSGGRFLHDQRFFTIEHKITDVKSCAAQDSKPCIVTPLDGGNASSLPSITHSVGDDDDDDSNSKSSGQGKARLSHSNSSGCDLEKRANRTENKTESMRPHLSSTLNSLRQASAILPCIKFTSSFVSTLSRALYTIL